MIPMWKSETAEAWTLKDGTLIVRRKVPLHQPRDGFDFIFTIETFLPCKVA